MAKGFAIANDVEPAGRRLSRVGGHYRAMTGAVQSFRATAGDVGTHPRVSPQTGSNFCLSGNPCNPRFELPADAGPLGGLGS